MQINFGICFIVLAFSVVSLTITTENQKGRDGSAKEIVEEFSTEQKKLLELHNKERTSKGHVALEIDKNLCVYAQKHAERMAKKNQLFHSNMSDLARVKESIVVGENIARGQKSEEIAVFYWMWSPRHRRNVLDVKYHKAGFGAFKDENGKYYWCAVFSS